MEIYRLHYKRYTKQIGGMRVVNLVFIIKKCKETAKYLVSLVIHNKWRWFHKYAKDVSYLPLYVRVTIGDRDYKEWRIVDNNAQHGIIFNDKFYKLIDGKSDEECCEKCALEEECWSVRQERQVLLCVVFSEAIGRSPKGCYFKEGMIIQKE